MFRYKIPKKNKIIKEVSVRKIDKWEWIEIDCLIKSWAKRRQNINSSKWRFRDALHKNPTKFMPFADGEAEGRGNNPLNELNIMASMYGK